eukprot:6176876-Pleurochrysis_carterae.AAC.2
MASTAPNPSSGRADQVDASLHRMLLVLASFYRSRLTSTPVRTLTPHPATPTLSLRRARCASQEIRE